MNGLSKIIIISMLFCTIAVSCRKDPLDYTSRMAGIHQINGVRYILNSADTPTNVSFIDSVFVVNNNTIVYRGFGYLRTMTCFTTDKKHKTSTFIYHYRSPTNMPLREDNDTVIYNYANNSINYSSYFNLNNYEVYFRGHN